jgi:predicted acylesterase/phospholipase RssA
LFGAYQAGAWRTLCERIRPDLVVGASIGSVNGWLIAGGCTPAELERFWLETGTSSLRWRMPRRPWSGVLDPGPLHQMLRDICAAYQPKVEYAVVVTELMRLRPTIIRGADVTWRHLAASCAVPAVFDQVRIGKRFYSDGGLLCANPLWAAAALGARRIVSVNVLERMPSRILRSGAMVVRRMAPFRPTVPGSVDVRVLTPSETLGGARDTIRPNVNLIRRWLDLGAADAARMCDSAQFDGLEPVAVAKDGAAK